MLTKSILSTFIKTRVFLLLKILAPIKRREVLETSGPEPKQRTRSLPLWTRKFVIRPLSAYWELRLKWVPETES